MIRTILIAATAATLLAAPARAEMTIRVSTIGKSVEQVKLDVTKAAKSICWRETLGATFPQAEYRACVDQTVKAALERTNDPALMLALK